MPAIEYPGVAQLGARLTGGQEAVSSSLATRTINRKKLVIVGLRAFFVLVFDLEALYFLFLSA